MLRNRLSGKQGFMADEQSSLSFPAKPLSSFLGSPRIFNGFWNRCRSDAENSLSMSPTSIPDGKLFLNFGHPFGFDRTLNPSPTPIPNPSIDKKVIDSGVGLALINSLSHDKNVLDSSQVANNSRMVLFGSNLKVQIPSPPTLALSPMGSPKSPADFGIKTPRTTQFLGYCLQPKESPPPKAKAEELSLSEMELSEDYTCVITHGPNPKTTHVFDDCIVESCCGIVRLSELKKENGFSSDHLTSPTMNSLSFCHTCKIKLGQGKDIYMYRSDMIALKLYYDD
ncbi:PREDICTED: protein MARD1-like isoform X2 [Ipomoea nil]|uniref:protein MARD1-like isoform X2 n=1 Tax=Ipomoea nil TaxID=35883 RepID=UPI0009008C9F|nr:PREDICTED: protein MARD1-like isoform X2 [Ipomoea nil]